MVDAAATMKVEVGEPRPRIAEEGRPDARVGRVGIEVVVGRDEDPFPVLIRTRRNPRYVFMS